MIRSTINKTFLPLLFVIFIPATIISQTYPGTHRFELRDLGVPYVNSIPPDESAVTSLITGPDGNIYGGTTGPTCHIFSFSITSNRVEPLGIIPGQQSIHHSMVVAGDGDIYFGTGLDETKQYPISDPVPGHGGIVISMWNDIENRYKDYEGGHLYRYDPAQSSKIRFDVHEPAAVEDMGVPVAGDGVYTLTTSPDGMKIYGLTYPHGHFFIYEVKEKKYEDKGEIYKNKVYGGPNRSLRSIARSLISDSNGNIYGSTDDQRVFVYREETDQLEVLDIKIPHIYISVIEVLTSANEDWIYGGTSEGFLFKFNPEKIEIVNLGKPLDQMRIRALTVGLDGKIYGIAGERKDRCHFFYFDPESRGFTDLGIINVDRTPYYLWMGKQFDAMVTGLDGTIYIGESERKSHLFIFYP
jgi:hypothetical protein